MQDGLAQGQVAFAGDRDDVLGMGAEAVGAECGDVRERPIEVVLGEVMPAERPPELRQDLLEVLGLGDLVLDPPRLLVGVRDADAGTPA